MGTSQRVGESGRVGRRSALVNTRISQPRMLGRWSPVLGLPRRCWCFARKNERNDRGAVADAGGAPIGRGRDLARAEMGGPYPPCRRSRFLPLPIGGVQDAVGGHTPPEGSPRGGNPLGPVAWAASENTVQLSSVLRPKCTERISTLDPMAVVVAYWAQCAGQRQEQGITRKAPNRLKRLDSATGRKSAPSFFGGTPRTICRQVPRNTSTIATHWARAIGGFGCGIRICQV